MKIFAWIGIGLIGLAQAFPSSLFGQEALKSAVEKSISAHGRGEASHNLSRPLIELSWNGWSPAGPGDSRSPCPGLNILANHGILPHSGKGITRDMMIKALTSTYNVDNNMAALLFDQGALRLGFSVLDLSVLNKHGGIEHDASLTRKDYGDAGNDNVSPQQNLVNQLKTFAVNGKLDIAGVSKARLLRIQQEKASDPNFDNGFVNAGTSLTEAVLAVKMLGGGDGSGLPVDWMDSLFMKEQFPSTWKPITNTYGALQFAADVAKVKACVDKVSLGLTSTC